MKRKLLMIAVSLASLLLFSGCKDYSDLENQLNNVKIENRLPKLGNERYRSMEDAEDAVYDQQIAACEMLSDTYDKTNPQKLDEDYKSGNKRVIEKCNNKRNEINSDVRKLFTDNIYEIMEDVRDCPNVDAYVSKTYSNVLTFYDEYNHYQTADDKDEALTDILVYYYDRTNVLAKSFLARNENEVFDSSVAVIEENARAEDSFRFYINKNNIVIKALNEVYGGVPEEYAGRINEAGNTLAVNLLNSLESLSDRERANLMDELGLSSPSPSPKPSATPSPEPSPSPEATPAPTPRPTATPRPAATQAPAATQRPSSQTTTTVVATQEPEREQTPSATEEPPVSFHFD